MAPSVPSPVAPAAARQLKWRLFLLAASGLLPLAVMVALALAYLVDERQQATQRSAMALSRALASAVDADLNAAIAALRTLGQSDELRLAEFEAFYRMASRVARQEGWRAMVLMDRQGQVLFRTTRPFGAPDPGPVEPESVGQALALDRPVVGVVTRGSQPGLAFAVRVPVQAGGTYVLTAVLPTDRVLNVLKRQSVPATWVVAVFDQSGGRVARTRPSSSSRASPSLQAMLATGRPEGMGVTTTLEGDQSHTGYTRLAASGWAVAVAIPAAEAIATAVGPALAVLTGLLASLALSAWLGRYFAGNVTQPIDSLKQAAAALGRGERVEHSPLAVAELDEVGAALAAASEQRERFMRELQAGQAEREALLRQVTDALQAAQEAGRVKDEFLAILGHELRNPLAPISMALQLMALKGDEATAPQRRIVERQLAHMTRLVDDLLDLSRITGKRLAMRMEPLRVADLVQRAAEAIRPVLGARTLHTQVHGDVAEAWVSGDEARLAQVFGNLLGNAVKFTGEHGRIALESHRAGDSVEVTVADDGAGMAPEVLQRAFEPFFQARQAQDRSRGGLGLGLAIVRSLVEMHGGSVAAQSDGPECGATVRVRLPLASAPAPREEPGPPPAAPGAGKVLVVDDNRDAADTTAALLAISGYEVHVAYEPDAALALVERHAPQVALLDIGLPGMSGYELARLVRAHPQGARCRLIALTGYGQADDVLMARRSGFDLHLTKPAGADVLLEGVSRLMGGPGPQ
ncbi:ATP-binding protein [Ramlibacter lithotrophicus]|nr:ATP-binding protein [Ramlibacter lithotrophicus]